MRKAIPVFILMLQFLLPLPRTLSEDGIALLPTSLPLPKAGPAKTIDVAVAVDTPQVFISTEGAFEMTNPNDSAALLKGTGAFQAEVVPKKEGIAVNGKSYPARQLVLKASQKPIQVGKREYLSQIRILKNSDTSLTVINRVDLEEYLKGVLPLEVHPKWPAEALKAQAVASRTYALFKSIEKEAQEFALRDTIESQVYGGALFHNEATDRAIEATRGEILTFEGNIFPAYFHAACGGRTTSPERIWPVHPSAVFKNVPCPFCKDTKHWKWSFEMPLTQIEAVMQKKGYPAKNLKQVSFIQRDFSGRVLKVILEYQRSTLTVSAVDFRVFLGYDKLKSLKAWAETKEDKVYFRGYGWGHGVGFCQWGSKGQADAGKNYREILKFYYPDAELKKI
jgi:stage II sporulation protein D